MWSMKSNYYLIANVLIYIHPRCYLLQAQVLFPILKPISLATSHIHPILQIMEMQYAFVTTLQPHIEFISSLLSMADCAVKGGLLVRAWGIMVGMNYMCYSALSLWLCLSVHSVLCASNLLYACSSLHTYFFHMQQSFGETYGVCSFNMSV